MSRPQDVQASPRRHSSPAIRYLDKPRLWVPTSARSSIVSQQSVDMSDSNPAPRWRSASRGVSPMTRRNTELEPFPELEETDTMPERRLSFEEAAENELPALQTTFTTEKEAVGGPKPGTPPEGKVRTTFLEVPPCSSGQDSARPVQSPLPEGSGRRLSFIDASSDVEDIQDIRDANKQDEAARFRSSFSSSVASSVLDSHTDAEDGANVIYHAARQARLKRPSLVNNQSTASAAGSNIQLARLAKFIQGRELHTVNTGEFSGSLDQFEGSNTGFSRPFSFGFDKGPRADANVVEERQHVSLPVAMRDIDRIELVTPIEPMSLADALNLNPTDHEAIPKRSKTLPSSLVSKRQARFAPLSITRDMSGSFRNDSTVTTPYPKLSQTGSRDNKSRGRSGSRSPKVMEFNLTVSARNRNKTISVPQFGTPQPNTTAWWNAQEVDDKKLVDLAKAEYASIQGRLRHYFGAKTAKAVHVRFLRSNKTEPFCEPDSPLIGGRWNSYAESDFWSLWVNPSQGQGKRDWLDVFTNHSKIYGVSRIFVLDIVEGYDATRVVLAFLTVTLLSLLAMFLWLFLGIDDFGTTHVFDARTKQTSGDPAASFLIGIWVLTLGWTGVGAWVFVS